MQCKKRAQSRDKKVLARYPAASGKAMLNIGAGTASHPIGPDFGVLENKQMLEIWACLGS